MWKVSKLFGEPESLVDSLKSISRTKKLCKESEIHVEILEVLSTEALEYRSQK